MAFSSSDIDRLTGSTVRGSNEEKIGSIGQVYVDPSGAPVWATVKTGLFGTSESFVPLDTASFAGDDVSVPFSKDVVKDAPRVESDGEISESETDNLYRYYEGHTAAGTDRSTSRDLVDDGAAAGQYDELSGTAVGDAGDEAASGARTETDKPHEGYDTSGPSTDDAMTRSEERLKVGTEKVESGRARLRKHIVTEQQTVTVPVTHEEATLVREPITEESIGDATAGPELSEEEHEVVLHGEEVVVSKDTVAVERVRLATEEVTEDRQVTADVRKEQIDYVDPDGATDR